LACYIPTACFNESYQDIIIPQGYNAWSQSKPYFHQTLTKSMPPWKEWSNQCSNNNKVWLSHLMHRQCESKSLTSYLRLFPPLSRPLELDRSFHLIPVLLTQNLIRIPSHLTKPHDIYIHGHRLWIQYHIWLHPPVHQTFLYMGSRTIY
jgi:hypothetical protein